MQGNTGSTDWKKILKITAIVYLCIAGLAAISFIITISSYTFRFAAYLLGYSATLYIIYTILLLGLEIVASIFAIKYIDDSSKIDTLFYLGIALMAAQLLNIILFGFAFVSLLAFVVPVLYFVCVYQLRNAR